jgi:hypothetical protein
MKKTLLNLSSKRFSVTSIETSSLGWTPNAH